MKLSKTEYRGGEALQLATKNLELVVTTSVGPRVVGFRSKEGRAGNLFLEFPPDAPRAHGYNFLGGHRLWHSPEDIVRTYQPDDDMLAVKELKNGVALAQPTEEKTGIQKAVKLEAVNDRTVKVTHALTNHGLWTVETAAWALTMFRAGGYGVLPLLPKGNHADGDLLPGYSLVPWTYTDLSAEVWDLHRDFIGIEVALAKTPHKLGITNYPGWSAYWLGGTTFVKLAPVVKGAAYPDFGCAFETFTNGEMIELETLSPLVKLEPGKSVTHVEHWGVLDGLKKPNTDKAFAELAAAVAAWAKKI
ncbi:MAG TPA: hypothetical protein VGD81_00970 [Opitutaceae bacterium]